MTNYERGLKLLNGSYTAYSPDFCTNAKKYKRYGTEPRVGAVIEYWIQNKGRIGHTGIVVWVQWKNGAWDFDVVEGNSNNAVMIHHRNVLPGQIGKGQYINGFAYLDYCAETCSAEQVITIARSQVGYKEKASNSSLESFSKNAGSSNWTKYGAWAKECGWGYNPAEWCAMFVSWVCYMACVSAHDYEPGWFKVDSHWMYRKKGGEYAKDEWIFDGGRWYVFDGAGYMVTGWYKDSTGDWYYLADDGGMLASQWIADGEKHYYFTASGAMARSAYIRADMPVKPGVFIYYWVDETGEWLPQWDTENPHLDIYQLAK